MNPQTVKNNNFFLILFLLVFGVSAYAQSPEETAVQLSLTPVFEDLFRLNWELDETAESYKVYEKDPGSNNWGDPIATLDGTETGLNVFLSLGTTKEYAVFKQDFPVFTYEVEVPAGANLSLEFTNSLGTGLCCNAGQGFFRLTGCDEEIAYGDDFGFTNFTTFTVCDNGNETETIILTVKPDMLLGTTTWILRDPVAGIEYINSGDAESLAAQAPAYGYLLAGNQLPAVEDRGGVLLLVEESIALPISPEVDRFRMDLVRDGWTVYTENVSMNQPVTEVKTVIQEVYQNNNDLNTVFIIGHVPVPYSGNIAPDLDIENHTGAWPADVYYGDVDGVWTDEVVNNISASDSRNHNIPGDGKFDQSTMPSEVELAIGRVDFFNMLLFPDSEIQLLKNYFQKNHFFRNGLYNNIQRKALIDDNFGVDFASPAASAYRGFSTMFTPENIVEGDYFSDLTNNSYYFSYASGNGTTTGATGVGSTTDFVNSNLQSLFTMTFGQGFGDWDTADNFLRAPLASGITLTNSWTGNPAWTYHHFSLGAPIGTSLLATQNSAFNNFIYNQNGAELTHIALMGDPTLRLYPGLGSPDAYATAGNNQIQLEWAPSGAANIIGYNVYRSNNQFTDYELINDQIIIDTTYTDFPDSTDQYFYLIKTIIVEQTASGTYINFSPGTPTNESVIVSNTDFIIDNNINVYPNPMKDLGFIDIDNPTSLLKLQLYNTLGQSILQTTIHNPSTSNQFHLPPKTHPGLYFLTIETEEGKTTQRILVNR